MYVERVLRSHFHLRRNAQEFTAGVTGCMLCWFSFKWLAGWVTDDSLCWCACLLPGRRVGDCSWLRSTNLVWPKENERLEIIGFAVFWKDCLVQWWIPKEPRDTSWHMINLGHYTTMLVLIGYNTYASSNKKEAVWVTFAFFMKNTSHLYLSRYVLAFFITSFYLTIFAKEAMLVCLWPSHRDLVQSLLKQILWINATRSRAFSE